MKTKCIKVLGATLALLFSLSVQASGADNTRSSILLGTNEVSAYSDAQIALGHEGSLRYVGCIFSHLSYHLELQFQPWRRVQQEVRLGAMDGFFTAMPSPLFEQFASLSDPLVLEKWYWFSRAGSESVADLKHLRTGAILGSHQQQWLEFNGVTNYLAAHDLPQLIKLMMAGRISAVLADLTHFEKAAASLGISPEMYQADFFRYVPLGVYFGHQFLAQNPGFLAEFNRHIPQCVPEGFALTAQEKSVIHERLNKRVAHWLQHRVLRERLLWHRQQGLLSEDEVQRRDRIWRQAYKAGDFGPMLALQDSQLTGFVSLWQNQEPFITELIITDPQGVNIAVAPYTSDYWQGDEDKHRQGIDLAAGQWWFGHVMYDQSTHRFQSQISLPIDIAGERLGVMTIGIDIEKALGERQSAGL